jgi:trehalose-6-phosphate synthase
MCRKRRAERSASCSIALKDERLYVLGIGVDRLNYTKGIIERFQAVERMLEQHPAMIGKFIMLQIALRSGVGAALVDMLMLDKERLSLSTVHGIVWPSFPS